MTVTEYVWIQVKICVFLPTNASLSEVSIYNGIFNITCHCVFETHDVPAWLVSNLNIRQCFPRKANRVSPQCGTLPVRLACCLFRESKPVWRPRDNGMRIRLIYYLSLGGSFGKLMLVWSRMVQHLKQAFSGLQTKRHLINHSYLQTNMKLELK